MRQWNKGRQKEPGFFFISHTWALILRGSEMRSHPGTGTEVISALRWWSQKPAWPSEAVGMALVTSPGLVKSSAQTWAADPHCTLPTVGPPQPLLTPKS